MSGSGGVSSRGSRRGEGEESPREGEGPRPQESPRARLFVGLELPGAVQGALIAWRDPILNRAKGVRPVARVAMHVTLCFLGWQAEEDISPIGDRCCRVAGTGVVALTLGEGLWLPRRRPRVLAVAIVDASEALARMQATLSAALADGGWYQPETRPFLAHTTVARLGRGARAERGALPLLPQLAFIGSEVTLFRSHLSSTGARYERLRVVSLG